MEKQILNLITLSYSSSNNIERENAYNELELLKKQNGYCSSLFNIYKETSISFEIRLLSCILLRTMIEENWGYSNKQIQQERLKKEKLLQREYQEEDEYGNIIKTNNNNSNVNKEIIYISENEKIHLRTVLLEGLHSNEMKIKAQFAIMISIIVKYDFPHDYPNLLEYLINQIENHSLGKQGSCLCLEMIIHPDYLFDDKQMDNVIQYIFPFILKIYKLYNEYSDSLRKSMIMIFFNIINYTVNRRIEKDTNQNNGILSYIKPFLNDWISQFIYDLEHSSHTPLRISIFQVLCLFIYSIPQTLLDNKYIHKLLPISWKLLVSLYPIYQDGCIYTSSLNQSTTDDIDFNCGTIYLFRNLILLILEFYHAILDKKILSKLMFLHTSLTEITYVLIGYMQYSLEQLEIYEFEIDQFVISEQEYTYGVGSLTVRTSSGKLLSELLSRYSQYSDIPIIDLITKGILIRLKETSEISLTSSEHIWKIREANIFSIIKSLRYLIRYSKEFMNNFGEIITSLLNNNNNNISFLSTRIYLCLCKVFKYFDNPSTYHEILKLIYEFIYKNITNNELTIEWVGSVLGLNWCISYLPKDLYPPFIDQILESLSYITSNSLEAESLLLSLDTILSLIKHSYSISGKSISCVISCILKLWQVHSQDSYINSYVIDILRAIVKNSNEEILGIVCNEGIPLIQQVLQQQELESEKVTAIDLLSILICASSKYPSSVNENGSILANLLLACFNTLISLLLNISNDVDTILISGSNCLFYIYSNGYSDIKEQSSLSQEQIQALLPQTLQYANKLLSNQVSDFVCSSSASLLNILIIRCSYLFISSNDTFFSLLQSIITRLYSTQFFPAKQNILCIIARLFCLNINLTIEYLQKHNLFENLIKYWIQEYPQFSEQYIGKLSIIVFGHLLLNSNSQILLNNITIPILITSISNGRVTRSSLNKNIEEKHENKLSPNRLMEILFGEYSLLYETNEDDDDDDFYNNNYDTDSEGSFDEDNEWDPLGNDDDDDDNNYFNVDDLLDGEDNDNDKEMNILLKLDPLTIPSTNDILQKILQTLRNQIPQLFNMELQKFSSQQQENIINRL